MDHRSITAFAAAFLLSPGLPGSSASDGARTTLSEPCELALSPLGGSLRTVLVRSGSFEAPFLFDTGGGGTALSLSAANALELAPFGRLTGFRHDGSRVDGPRAGPLELALGTFSRHGEVGVLDLDALLAGF